MSQEKAQAVHDYIDDYYHKGWIHEPSSQFGNPILITLKMYGKLHMVVDYQTLNAWTVPEKHPLPCIDD